MSRIFSAVNLELHASDEWKAALRRDAELSAFHVLQRALPILVAVDWILCFTLPIVPLRAGLLISVVGVSGLAIALFALPQAILLWKIQGFDQGSRIVEDTGN